MTQEKNNDEQVAPAVAIIGLGLMGGSLAMALRRRGAAGSIRGWTLCHLARLKALQEGIIDAAFETPAEAVRGADIIVFCTPVLQIVPVAETCRRAFERGCLITDVGSTKGQIVDQMTDLLAGTGAHFIGSHPMTGSEASGLEAARADLYDDAVVILTPTAEQAAADPPEPVDRLARFWESVGARTIRMSSRQHDSLVARTSHLPHLVAALLVDTVSRDDVKGLASFCGRGFDDTTRVAAGSEDVWHDIVATNRSAIMEELEQYGRRLEQVQSMLEREDLNALKQWLRQNREQRARIRG